MKTICTVIALLCSIGVVLTVKLEADTDHEPIVRLQSGTVRGLKEVVNGKKINFYQGIAI